jgi:hypothetical protein
VVRRNTNRTTHHYLAGIGASGALLACALAGFLSLIGVTSVSVWPDSGAPGAPEVVELQSPPAKVKLTEAQGLIASTDVLPPAPAGPDRAGSGKRGGDRAPQGQTPAPPAGGVPAPAPGPGGSPEPAGPPSTGGPTQGRGNGDGPGGDQDGKDRSSPVDCDTDLIDGHGHSDGHGHGDDSRGDHDWDDEDSVTGDWSRGPSGDGDSSRGANLTSPVEFDETDELDGS